MREIRKGKRKWRAALVSIVVATAAAIAVAYMTLLGSVVNRETTVYVRQGESAESIIGTLSSDGTITKPCRMRLAAKIVKRGAELRPGRYELRRGMSALEAVLLMKNGNQSPINITFNNIRTLPQLAASLGRQLHADSTEFASVFTNDSIAQAYGFRPEEFVGMFIPNTYEVYWTISPGAFVERMNKEYRRFWNDTREAALQRTGLTAKQVATLASIVDEETLRTDEMPLIAGVYINRLRRGMPLQADPTVKYAVGDFSLRRVLHRHIETDSPYNTYLYAGLPPGPIRMPSIAAIDAVLNYREHDYLYFCARADFSGYHSFASTLPEHNRNARKYTAALDRLGIR